MSNISHNLHQQLDRIEKLARSTKFQRFRFNPLHYTYGIFFSKFIYPIFKRGKIVEVFTFFGTKMKVLLPAGTDIYLLGAKSHDSEIRLTRYLINRLESDDLFFDIGSHYGFFSLLAAELIQCLDSVYCFEASAKNYHLLAANCQSKGQIKINHLAVTDHNEVVTFYEFPAAYSENNTLDNTIFTKENWYQQYQPIPIKVEGRTVSSICQGMGKTPTIIKIDVEGAESAVIAGMADLFAQKKFPEIIMEYWIDPNRNASHQCAIKQLESVGYQFNVINNRGQLSKVDDVRQHFSDVTDESDNLVLVHNAGL